MLMVSKGFKFFSHHRDTIVIILKNARKKWHCILKRFTWWSHSAAICFHSFQNQSWYVPFTTLYWQRDWYLFQMMTNTGIGVIYGTILGLTMQCLGNGQWSQSVQLQTDSEITLVSVFVPRHQLETKFDVQVQQQELLLCKAVIECLSIVCEWLYVSIDAWDSYILLGRLLAVTPLHILLVSINMEYIPIDLLW